MNKRKNICDCGDCGVCLDSIVSKDMNHSIQLECGHWFHTKCTKIWCMTCIKNDDCPTCPLCRQNISDEYLDILDIHYPRIDFFTRGNNLLSLTIELYMSYESILETLETSN